MNDTKIKFCGLTRVEDVHAACAAGASAIGFVFYPGSPRHITPDRAAELMREAPAFITPVGLFVNATADEIAEILKQVPLDMLQFHGDETPEQCQAIAQYTARRWYKAIQVKPDLDVIACIKKYQDAGASAVLLDAWHPELKGGTGHSFDWTQFPQLDIPLILAGGLKPDNIEDAIQTAQPFAVDVSGGVESTKGIKDQQLIQRFMQGVQRGSAK